MISLIDLVGLFTVGLQLLFIAAQLFGYKNWPLHVLLAPFMVPVLFFGVCLIAVAVIAFIPRRRE